MQIEQLGPYRLGRQLGKGGMGSVYEGVDVKTGQRVAVKALAPQLAAAEGFRERFEAEIESLKKLQHEGIVRLYGYGEDDGMLFYSMELVDGPSLEQELCDGRRFDWRETLDIAIQVCKALKHAHDHGVVHRDIKPANLLLDRGERVKIADFGIARLFGATQLTSAGGILGTADYMSPEQVDGRAVTERCDQYALGCVMFALLAGRPPFRAKTMAEMLQMQRYAEPESVRRYAPQTPAPLDWLIKQLLNKDPAARFPNVLVLSRHMEAMQKALSRPSREDDAGAGDDGRRAPLGTADALSLEATSALREDATVAPAEPLARLETTDSDVYEAPTLADNSLLAAAAGAVSEASAAGGSRAVAAPGTTPLPPSPAPAKQRRFTTVDEDAAERARRAEGEGWLLALQLAGLAATLGALAWLGWWMTRPPTADTLYATIAGSVEAHGADDLRSIADEIHEFLDRFPQHPRAVEVQAYADELDLQKMERQLRTRARVRGERQAHPAAGVYAEALAVEESNPARALELLRGLVTLYQSAGEAPSASDDDRAYAALAQRQVDRLQKQLDAEAGQQLPALKLRLQAARRLEGTSPAQAAAMYAAIVDLYAARPWAAPVVAEAAERLQAVDGNP